MDEKQYEIYNDMFATEGWKLFTESGKELEKTILEALAVESDANQFFKTQGMLAQLRSIMNFPATVEFLWKQQLEEDEEEESQDALTI